MFPQAAVQHIRSLQHATQGQWGLSGLLKHGHRLWTPRLQVVVQRDPPHSAPQVFRCAYASASPASYVPQVAGVGWHSNGPHVSSQLGNPAPHGTLASKLGGHRVRTIRFALEKLVFQTVDCGSVDLGNDPHRSISPTGRPDGPGTSHLTTFTAPSYALRFHSRELTKKNASFLPPR